MHEARGSCRATIGDLSDHDVSHGGEGGAQEGREGSDFLVYQLQDVRRCIPDSLVFKQRTLE
jgi:hypothetical protein